MRIANLEPSNSVIPWWLRLKVKFVGIASHRDWPVITTDKPVAGARSAKRVLDARFKWRSNEGRCCVCDSNPSTNET